MSGAQGKTVFNRTYWHVDAIPDNQLQLVNQAAELANLDPTHDFNVVRIAADLTEIGLLDYADFFGKPFPVLRNSWKVDVAIKRVIHRSYATSLNPPILHRKELLISKDHPERRKYEALTHAAEQIGLFDDTNRIGFKAAWDALLLLKGFKVVDHELLPIGNDETGAIDEPISAFERVERHRTALTRYDFSAPMQTLARFGFLDGSKSVFDYGCGRGDDLRNLSANEIPASGWDPHYAPDGVKRQADIVNLGFVINVVENRDERAEALQGAYALAKELLVVSAMLSSQESVKGVPYGDGVLTARSTFQKYYSQDELRNYIAGVLEESPIPIAPGIIYVFKDKDAEQRFMYGRQENRRALLRLAYLSRPPKPTRTDRALAKYEEHRELLENLWQRCLALGRAPENEEVSNLDEIKQNFTSIKAAIRFIFSIKESANTYLEESRRGRIEDLTVYFAQLQFEKKKPYRQLEPQLQRDVRAFFGDYKSATLAGRELLFRLAQPEVIDKACAEAASKGVGWYEPSDFLQLHSSLVPQLPSEIRAYIACGTALYGDVSSADLVKVHIRSGKLTLMRFDDFAGKPLPRMVERTKINLREQDIDYFLYEKEFPPPFLYNKSRYINEEFPGYPEQVAFDEQLASFPFIELSGYGPTPKDLEIALEKHRWAIQGMQLVRSKTIPDLDTPCGATFRYRDLIECGETQKNTGIPNLPREADSYTALYELTTKIIDPIIDYFGMIELTYGFCSSKLAKEIPARIAPKLDQHASHEIAKNGQVICQRLGAAVDFLVVHEDMGEVAQWIIENLPFDRLYFYDTDKPIHVSFGPDQSRSAFRMQEVKPGVRVPRPFQQAALSR
jgi:DNA phosphorothioation-associated putative methyltransferase